MQESSNFLDGLYAQGKFGDQPPHICIVTAECHKIVLPSSTKEIIHSCTSIQLAKRAPQLQQAAGYTARRAFKTNLFRGRALVCVCPGFCAPSSSSTHTDESEELVGWFLDGLVSRLVIIVYSRIPSRMKSHSSSIKENVFQALLRL